MSKHLERLYTNAMNMNLLEWTWKVDTIVCAGSTESYDNTKTH